MAFSSSHLFPYRIPSSIYAMIRLDQFHSSKCFHLLLWKSHSSSHLTTCWWGFLIEPDYAIAFPRQARIGDNEYPCGTPTFENCSIFVIVRLESRFATSPQVGDRPILTSKSLALTSWGTLPRLFWRDSRHHVFRRGGIFAALKASLITEWRTLSKNFDRSYSYMFLYFLLSTFNHSSFQHEFTPLSAIPPWFHEGYPWFLSQIQVNVYFILAHTRQCNGGTLKGRFEPSALSISTWTY